MSEPTRVFRPLALGEVSQVQAAMAGLDIPFFIENENFFATGGGLVAPGDTQVWVTVPSEHADAALEALTSWFDEPSQ